MNILLTSVGRRGYLVEYFKSALQGDGKVIAANSVSLTTGMVAADKSYLVPPVDSDSYIPEIINICKKENVNLVVSLFDIDLPYLSREYQKFADQGITVVVSEYWVVDVANDKWKTFNFLSGRNISTPRTFLSLEDTKAEIIIGKLNFPLIIKPRWGMGSLSIFKAENERELKFFYSYAKRQIAKSYLNILSHDELDKSVVIQEFIDGKEYGLDVFNDLEGNHLVTVVKEKLAMRSGETDIACVIDEPRLNVLGNMLAKNLLHRGNIDVDILENSDGELFVLEINARFGGGYPFSHLAGANFPLALVDMVNKKEPRGISDINYGVIGLKSLSVIEAKQ